MASETQISSNYVLINLIDVDHGERKNIADNPYSSYVTWLRFTKNNNNDLNIYFEQLRHPKENTDLLHLNNKVFWWNLQS